MFPFIIPAVLMLVVVMALVMIMNNNVILGFPYKATGAVAGTVATIYDPVLRAAITTITVRGGKRSVNVLSATYNSDVPGLGSHCTITVGNDGVDRYTIDMFPNLDGDLATQPIMLNGLTDLGGFEVNENEAIIITVYDPGASELCSGVLYIEDNEPSFEMPTGRPITLSFGGTNDAATSWAITGGDKPTVKLEGNYNYAVIGGVVRAEDKVCEGNILMDGNGSTCTLPGQGKVIFPRPAMIFTGEQWNNGSVSQFLQVQAATKVETIYYLIEFKGKNAQGNEKPIKVSPQTFPGQPNVATNRPISGGISMFKAR